MVALGDEARFRRRGVAVDPARTARRLGYGLEQGQKEKERRTHVLRYRKRSSKLEKANSATPAIWLRSSSGSPLAAPMRCRAPSSRTRSRRSASVASKCHCRASRRTGRDDHGSAGSADEVRP